MRLMVALSALAVSGCATTSGYSSGCTDMSPLAGLMSDPNQAALSYRMARGSYQDCVQAQRYMAATAALEESTALEMAQKQKARDLAVALARPEIQIFAEAFDRKYGQGSFRTLVIQHGEKTWQETGGKVDLTPDQAASHVVGAMISMLKDGSLE